MVANQAVASLTALLKKHNVGISAVKANKLLLAAGILEERTRPSSRDPSVTKKFKIFTPLGRQFGDNIENSLSPNETMPKFYVDSFAQLAKTYFK